MGVCPENALVVQSDCSVLLELHSPRAEKAREAIAPFTELVKSPEHVHTYRLTPLSIWNARAAGLVADEMVAALHEHSRYPVPENVDQTVLDLARRFGRVVITREDGRLRCTCGDEVIAEFLSHDHKAGKYLADRIDDTSFRVDPGYRGVLKQALVSAGYPAEDLAGYVNGDALEVSLRDRTISGAPFSVRKYQRQAAESFYASGSARGGSGVIVLPCGAGKTIVGLAAIEMVGQTTLVLTTSLTSVTQWRREICDKTSLVPAAIAEYTGEQKSTGPVTLTTYQMLTWRSGRKSEFPHLELFRARSWGLIIYDEVHLLPAPVFRATADLQARRRIAKEIGASLVTGKTPQAEREQIYDRFRRGELRCIVLSKVGNFAIDLPDADVLIQVSGVFGSRQEEAQRLGRILRPKADGRAANFFTLVSRDTREEEFAHHRKLFLTEQGYSYQVVIADEP